MQKARFVTKGKHIHIYTPYNRSLVDHIRGIPGRHWNGDAWMVPVAAEQQARDLVRQFYQIEGEECYIPFVVRRVHVTSAKEGYHTGNITIDEIDLFEPSSGYLNMEENEAFTILDYAGGFTEAYKNVRHREQGYEIDYTLRIKIREDARWKAYPPAVYEILNATEIDQFLDKVAEDL